MNYPFQLEQIDNWLRAMEAFLDLTSVQFSVNKTLKEATKPAAFAGFFGKDAAGRITGWVSAEFNFEVIRMIDDKTL